MMHYVMAETVWSIESVVCQMNCCFTYSHFFRLNKLSLQPFFPSGGPHSAIHSLLSDLTLTMLSQTPIPSPFSACMIKPRKTTVKTTSIGSVVLLILSCSLPSQSTNPLKNFTSAITLDIERDLETTRAIVRLKSSRNV